MSSTLLVCKCGERKSQSGGERAGQGACTRSCHAHWVPSPALVSLALLCLGHAQDPTSSLSDHSLNNTALRRQADLSVQSGLETSSNSGVVDEWSPDETPAPMLGR